MKKLDLVILCLALFDLAFVITMIVIFYVKDAVPDQLIICVLGGSGVELLLSAWITTTKEKCRKKVDENEEEIDEQEVLD